MLTDICMLFVAAMAAYLGWRAFRAAERGW